MKYLVVLALIYLAYRVIRPLLTPSSVSKSVKSKVNKSLEIPEEDIRDAEFRDMNEE
ncbi:MAG: hypothetical protein ACE5HZ_02105 [Fidelibacterota bacterium]